MRISPFPAFALVFALTGAPSLAQQTHPTVPEIFRTGDRCIACHKGVTTSSGKDVSIGFDWRASMMANAARDPYWQAAVRREVTDHPMAAEAIEDKCATCHMPMARTMAHLAGGSGEVFANLPIGGATAAHAPLAADGVSCSTCHQITPEGLGEPESFTGGYVIESTGGWGERTVFGPYPIDAGRTRLMSSAVGYRPTEGDHMQSSELCASCHTLYTHPLDEEGNEIGELPEQVPYLEWVNSDYPEEGRGCQSCHMPVVREPVPLTGVLGEARDSVSRHVFRGGNFFMLGMLNRNRDDLGVEALPQELDAAVSRTLEHLRANAARLEVEGRMEGRQLVLEVAVENLGGHKLPTAYPSRRSWLHVVVRDSEGRSLFESGAVRADGSIVGNDNDADASLFERHHERVESEDQVQIYEAVMVDDADRVTTGLLRGVRYVKDNRVLPRGFDKAGADPDVAVHGAAARDADFADGADRVTYRADTGAASGPYAVEVTLRYQPIGYRWARNLAAYDAMETERFVRWYDDMAGVSSAVLATRAVVVPAG